MITTTQNYLIETPAATDVTLNLWYDIWMENYKIGRIKPTTIDTYNWLYDKHIRYTIGEHALREFHPVHIQKLYNDFLKKGYSAKYLNTLHCMLNSLFKTSMINELIDINPCSFADRPSGEVIERRVLSVEEEKMIRTAIRQKRFSHIEPAITTLLGTGMRIGELLGLRWDDVHIFDNNTTVLGVAPSSFITVSHTLVRIKNPDHIGSRHVLQLPKTKNSIRVIPLQKSVIEALKRQKLIQEEYQKSNLWEPDREFEGLVFAGKKGQPQWRSTVVSSIDTVVRYINEQERIKAASAGLTPREIKPVLPHSLRHTFATRCLEAGIPAKVVQEWLGHASIKMTMDLYTHVSVSLSAEYMLSLEANRTIAK